MGTAPINMCYTFNHSGLAVHPLVILGENKSDVFAYLERYKTHSIYNKVGIPTVEMFDDADGIEDMATIYMSVSPYTPGKRFTGLFPLHDAVQAVVQGAAAFAPGNTITDVAGAGCDLASSIKQFFMNASPATPNKNNYFGPLYIKFHYLTDTTAKSAGLDGRPVKVASTKISFESIKALLDLIC